MRSQSWFQTALGQKHEIPQTEEYPIVVGRASASGAGAEGSVLIPQSKSSMTVSRKHAHLWCNEAGEWEIADTGSSHGLFVDGKKLSSDERVKIKSGTQLSFGKYAVSFQVEGAAVDSVEDLDDEGGGATIVVGDFSPGAAAAAFSQPSAGVDEKDQIYFDFWLDGGVRSLAFPQIPGVNQWTFGRQVRKEPRPQPGKEVIDHVQVPVSEETKAVSRQHARLFRDKSGGWKIRSLSSQGLMIGSKKVSEETDTVLEFGDKISMGRLVFVFRQGTVEAAYSEEDFDIVNATGGAWKAATAAGDADSTRTREISKDLREAALAAGADQEPWGYLVENNLMNPRRYTLSKRKTKIGSHPLNSDIKMEGGGITDLFAIIQWGAKDVKIVSKSSGTPVRVNHAPYRTSPALADGNIITLGTREFHIEIVGDPPVAASTIILGTVRRWVILFGFVLLFSTVASLGGVHLMTPKPQATPSLEKFDLNLLIKEVVEKQGLAGLKLLEASGANAGEVGLASKPVFKALHDLNEAHRMIHKLPAKRFEDNVDLIEKKLESGRKVFELAGLSPALVDDENGWFRHDIEEVFEDRRVSAYSTQWQDFLDGLKTNNIANARRQLDSLAHFPKRKRDAARAVVDLWVKSSAEALVKNEDDILQEYRKAGNQGRSSAYIKSEAERLDQLVANFDSIQNDRSDPARALVSSPKWKLHHSHVKTLRTTLGLLEHYIVGDIDSFNKTVSRIDAGSQTKLIATMKKNLQEWREWKGRYNASTDALSDFRLLSDLQQLQLKFKGSLDDNSSLAKDIQKRIDSFEGNRITQAVKLRAEAAKMPEGFAKLIKLVQAYDYDNNEKAEEEFDSLAVKLCGKIAREGSLEANAANLRTVLKRYDEMVAKGLMSPDSVVSMRQMKKLLSGLE